MSELPSRVRVMEVGPRDGLQNEPAALPVTDKIEFVNRLAASGLRDIEVTSFVRPDRVPQLADAERVLAGIDRAEGVRYWALVPNARGLDRARAAGVRHIAVFTAATDGFARANVNVSVEESLAKLRPVVQAAKDDGIVVRGYVSTAFGCPYEGAVLPSAPARVARTLLDAGCDEISLGDTIGVAVPDDVERVLEAMEEMGLPRGSLALHLHDTFGTALANVHAGLRAGVTVFDSSAGGLGGCPFAPGAAGNLATEDLLYLLDGLGIETGVRLEGVYDAAEEVAQALEKALPSRAHAALRAKWGR
ncbi:MAG TPA: hydroxymethylglutaryl-CoA lyase [bacterium]|nr:hydroxymethylglutaryl-CoA lyase [bacterium]